MLLRHQADVNARDKNWQTPLHIAAANNAVKCAEFIIPLLTNVNVSDRSGRTSLHHAAFNGHLEVLHSLPDTQITIFTRAVELGFYKRRFLGFKKLKKISKAQFSFLRLLKIFLLCNLIKKRYIQILIVICEIHQFHLYFSVFTRCSSFAHWRFVFSMICMGCLSCSFGSYFHVRSSYQKPKNLKTYKNFF